MFFFFFKQKTAYEMRISDWSSDVCSSDLERNVRALLDVQPADLRPSDITARLGAPWIPAADVVAFVKQKMEADIRIHHMPELGSWTVERSEERRVGKECVSTCRSRWSQYH